MWESTRNTDGNYFPSTHFRANHDHVIDFQQLYGGYGAVEKAGTVSANCLHDLPSSSTMNCLNNFPPCDNFGTSSSVRPYQEIDLPYQVIDLPYQQIDTPSPSPGFNLDLGSLNQFYQALSRGAGNGNAIHTCVASDACVRCRGSAFTLDNLSACVCEDPMDCPHERVRKKRLEQCNSYSKLKNADADSRLFSNNDRSNTTDTSRERRENFDASSDEDSVESTYSSTSSSSTSSSSSASSSSSTFSTFNLMMFSESSSSSSSSSSATSIHSIPNTSNSIVE